MKDSPRYQLDDGRSSPVSIPAAGTAGGIAVTAGVPLPTIAAAMGHANLQITAVCTTTAHLEAQDFLARMWAQESDFGRIQRLKTSGEGP